MLVFLFLEALGPGDSHVPSFWLRLYSGKMGNDFTDHSCIRPPQQRGIRIPKAKASIELSSAVLRVCEGPQP